jgi:polyferredoxin
MAPRAGAAERFVRRLTGLGVWRWVKFLGLGLIVFYPLFRCFFKVPYLFCHVCPRPCVFGYFRPYLIPMALLMNLNNRHWCYHSCPVGTLLQSQHSSIRKPGPGRRPWWMFLAGVGLVGFTVFAYFRMLSDRENRAEVASNWFDFFYKNNFGFSVTVLVVVGLIVLLGMLWRRAFCQCLCPVGTLSELYLKGERALAGRSSGGKDS